MTDEYKRGLVTGLAMQPLRVVQKYESKSQNDAYCAVYISPFGTVTDEGYCLLSEETE